MYRPYRRAVTAVTITAAIIALYQAWKEPAHHNVNARIVFRDGPAIVRRAKLLTTHIGDEYILTDIYVGRVPRTDDLIFHPPSVWAEWIADGGSADPDRDDLIAWMEARE